jgi:hypothetical protein
MSPHPEIHHRHALTGVLDRSVPAFCNQSAYPVLQLGTGQHRLCLIRSHHTRTHSRTYHSARVREQEKIRGVV